MAPTVDDETTPAAEAQLPDDSRENPTTNSAPTDGKQQRKPVMVYMKAPQKAAFRRWTFEREQSMSAALIEMADELMSRDTEHPTVDETAGAHSGSPSPLDQEQEQPEDVPNAALGVDENTVMGEVQRLAAQVTGHTIELGRHLWAALEAGIPLPELETVAGLSSEQLRHALRAGELPRPGH